MCFCVLLDHRSGHEGLFLKDIQDGPVHAIIVATGKFAMIGLADGLIFKANLVLSRDGQCPGGEAPFFHQLDGIFRHRPRDGFGRGVKPPASFFYDRK